MKIKAEKTTISQLQFFRQLFLQENNFQIRYNACHERNWTDPYLLTLDDVPVGYGSIKGKEALTDRDAIFEFYLLPHFRNKSTNYFDVLVKASGAKYIECQSNDLLLTFLLYEFAENINSEVLLFEDHIVTNHVLHSIIFRPRKKDDAIFKDRAEDLSDYVLERSGDIVATGGFLLHYNMPFADLYMETRADCRRQGLATYLLQELKKECYMAGRVPAARCNIKNRASKASLIKAGLRVCGLMLMGQCRNE